MISHNKFILYSLFLLFLASCSTPQNLAYFQDAEDVIGMALLEEQPLRLKPQDKINIVVNSSDPMLVQQFNLLSMSVGRSLGSTVAPKTTAGQVYGSYGTPVAYTVDEQGDITFPVLGKLSVIGKTRQEVASYIENRLITRELVKDPIVTVEYVNMGIEVLGEVNHPGHIDIVTDKITILEAISRAGDLTINGLRENVMVSRQVDGEDRTYFVDLTSRQAMLESPGFYLQQNDVVYVTPSDKRLRESKATGNTFNNPSIWLSIATVLITITTLIIR